MKRKTHKLKRRKKYRLKVNIESGNSAGYIFLTIIVVVAIIAGLLVGKLH